MSYIGVKRRRRERKMDTHTDHPPGSPECCVTEECLDPCTDEQCLKFMEQYCQTCPECLLPECRIECEECCEDTTCTDGQYTEVFPKTEAELTVDYVFAAFGS
jgi:hypothetical protein